MRTVIKTILIGVVLSASAGQALAYSPDNAAVLYYKAFMLLEEPNDSVKKMLRDLKDGKIGLNEQIWQYVERNRKVINEIKTAAEIKTCDWGLDFSEGFSLEIPHLAKCRQMAYILAAEAKILSEKGDYRTALERCITIQNMGVHVGDDILISYLVGTAVINLANKSIADILSEMPEDLETLVWLQIQMTKVSSRPLSVEAALAKETESLLREMRRERIGILIEQLGVENPSDPNSDSNSNVIEQLLRISQEDETFFEKSRDYYTSHTAAVQAAFELPYSQAHEELIRLGEKISEDAKEKHEALLTHIICPPTTKINSIRAARETFFNAIKSAIGIYIIKAKTGKLPGELPAGLPKDMFSGKDFLYEKTDASFTLTGQGKDLDKDIVQKYEFKVAK